MEGFWILILYVAILILQILMLVFCIKTKRNKKWYQLLIMELASIIGVFLILGYFDGLKNVGMMSFLGVYIFSFGAALIYLIVLLVTICTNIVLYGKAQKQQGKNHPNSLLLILSVVFIMLGILSLFYEVFDNWGKKETIGTVVAFKEKPNMISKNEKGEESLVIYSVINFMVNGKEYQDEIFMDNVNIGDNVNSYYELDEDSSYHITYLMENKWIYIPAFLCGFLLLLFSYFRFRWGKEQTKER